MESSEGHAIRRCGEMMNYDSHHIKSPDGVGALLLFGGHGAYYCTSITFALRCVPSKRVLRTVLKVTTPLREA